MANMCVTNVPSEPMTGSQSSPNGVATQTCHTNSREGGKQTKGADETEEGEAAKPADTIKDNKVDTDGICQVLWIWEMQQHRPNFLKVPLVVCLQYRHVYSRVSISRVKCWENHGRLAAVSWTAINLVLLLVLLLPFGA